MKIESKFKSLPAVLAALARARRHGRKIVFTNGCFDILHVGHLRYLRAARRLGRCLVVGVNTDASVRKIKEPGRPIVPQRERAELLAGFDCVDFVVLFNDPTPEKLIHRIRPDVLVKGADWAGDKIVGADFVKSRGGRVVRIPLAKGRSTTALINKIARLRKHKNR